MTEFKLTDLEALANKADQLSSMANSLEDAMFNGMNDANNYGSAMELFAVLMLAHSREMTAFFNTVYATQKEAALTRKDGDAV